MKRFDSDQRERWLRLSQERFVRRLARKRRRSQRRKSESSGKFGRSSKPLRLKEELAVPAQLCIDNHFDVTMKFIGSIQNEVLRKKRRVTLDFDKCESITPSAALMLVAEVFRCRKLNRKKSVNGSYPSSEVLEQELQDMGFYELIDVADRPIARKKSADYRYVKFLTGTRAVGLLARQLRESIAEIAGPFKQEAVNTLFKALSEAMTNVAQHAYVLKDRWGLPRLTKRWWVIGVIESRTNMLSVLFFDQGVGIPRTLPVRNPHAKIQQVLASLGLATPTDGDMIRAAMEIGKTRTEREHQGYGLNDLRKFVEVSGYGSLTIRSGRGIYALNADGSQSWGTLVSAVPGTLIEWRVHLPTVLSNTVSTDSTP